MNQNFFSTSIYKHIFYALIEKIHSLKLIIQNLYPAQPLPAKNNEKCYKQSCILFKYKTFDSRFTERKLHIIIFFTYIALFFSVQVVDYSWCYWIGLTDLNSEGVWLWNHSRTNNSLWDNFYTYQGQYHCGMICSNTWYSWSCSSEYNFICGR